LDGHLTGAFLCTRSAIPGLRARRGAIVNIASTRALQSEPHCEAYAAAKGGLLAFTHAAAISLGPLIRVNSVSPGWIETGPLQKLQPRDSLPISTQAGISIALPSLCIGNRKRRLKSGTRGRGGGYSG
jgi:NAD(P)-dependent dehydrogenase (short-subunit alcohol dehydrogenase family)